MRREGRRTEPAENSQRVDQRSQEKIFPKKACSRLLIESCQEIKENDGRQENVRSANAVLPCLSKDRLRRQDVGEVLLVKGTREVECNCQERRGGQGSLFTLKDV